MAPGGERGRAIPLGASGAPAGRQTGTRRERDVGTVQHAVATITAALMALKSNRERHLSLGMATARLLESQHVDGVSSVLTEITHSVDRYGYVE